MSLHISIWYKTKSIFIFTVYLSVYLPAIFLPYFCFLIPNRCSCKQQIICKCWAMRQTLQGFLPHSRREPLTLVPSHLPWRWTWISWRRERSASGWTFLLFHRRYKNAGISRTCSFDWFQPPATAFFTIFSAFFQVEEDEKLKKRKERFGALTSASSATSADVEVCLLSSAFHFVCVSTFHLSIIM